MRRSTLLVRISAFRHELLDVQMAAGDEASKFLLLGSEDVLLLLHINLRGAPGTLYACIISAPGAMPVGAGQIMSWRRGPAGGCRRRLPGSRFLTSGHSRQHPRCLVSLRAELPLHL